jgi:LysR family transcriptional activator of nhaA
MQHLNYNHLRYFFETARRGSMSAAARALRVTQPTVSAQIRELEEQCGGPLLEREGNRWLLTALGQHVHTYAADIFALGDELRATLQGPAIAAPLRVGVVEALPKLVVYGLLEPALTDVDAGFVVRQGELSNLVERLRVHELDLVLSDYALAPQHATVHNHPLGRSPVGIFGAPSLCASHPLPERLEGAPFLLLPRTASLRRSLDHVLHRDGAEVRIVAEMQDSALIKVFASKGHGFIVAPLLIADHLREAFGLELAWELPDATEDLFLLSMERHVEHPAARHILQSARQALDRL